MVMVASESCEFSLGARRASEQPTDEVRGPKSAYGRRPTCRVPAACSWLGFGSSRITGRIRCNGPGPGRDSGAQSPIAPFLQVRELQWASRTLVHAAVAHRAVGSPMRQTLVARGPTGPATVRCLWQRAHDDDWAWASGWRRYDCIRWRTRFRPGQSTGSGYCDRNAAQKFFFQPTVTPRGRIPTEIADVRECA